MVAQTRIKAQVGPLDKYLAPGIAPWMQTRSSGTCDTTTSTGSVAMKRPASAGKRGTAVAATPASQSLQTQESAPPTPKRRRGRKSVASNAASPTGVTSPRPVATPCRGHAASPQVDVTHELELIIAADQQTTGERATDQEGQCRNSPDGRVDVCVCHIQDNGSAAGTHEPSGRDFFSPGPE